MDEKLFHETDGAPMRIERDRGEEPVRPRVMRIPEMARQFGIPVSTAYDLAKADRLPVPVLRLGRRVFVSRSAVDAVLSERKDS